MGATWVVDTGKMVFIQGDLMIVNYCFIKVI